MLEYSTSFQCCSEDTKHDVGHEVKTIDSSNLLLWLPKRALKSHLKNLIYMYFPLKKYKLHTNGAIAPVDNGCGAVV